jgi:hypothetical protein
MRVQGTRKDKGHHARKAAWLTVGCLLFIPHALFTTAAKADELIALAGERLRKWSHPCLYHENPPRKEGTP